jgi:hypothetical protein
MRLKLTIISACAATLIAASTAYGAVTVALYAFSTQDDVNAFQKVTGSSCTKKWKNNMQMSITVGRGTNSCGFRTSVLADSSDTLPDQALVATVCLSPCASGTKKGTGTNTTTTTTKRSAKSAALSPKLTKLAYMGVSVRQSDTAGYELRVLPGSHKWQFLRDPKGPAPAALDGSGSAGFIKAGTKPNVISLRAFNHGTTTTELSGTINGQSVVAKNDTAADQPDGGRTVVTTGAKGTAAGTGIIGIFDDVTVQVPNPF